MSEKTVTPTLSIDQFRIMYDGASEHMTILYGTRPMTFDDLASLEGAEKVWRCSVDGLNYSVKVCDHEGITPPCGWWIRIPVKEEE